MGAKITGAGTDRIRIQGVEELKTNGTYSVVPDQIEAGTFMLAAVATRGDITIKNCITKHLESITAKIAEMGANVEDLGGDAIRVSCSKRPNKINIKTLPYPGFPTDLQPQMGVIMATANRNKCNNRKYMGLKISICRRIKQNGSKNNSTR